MSSLRLLRYCAVIGLALLVTGCTFSPTLRIGSVPDGELVYENEYIFTAPSDGAFSPYPRVKGDPVFPKGANTTFVIDKTSREQLVKLSGENATQALSTRVVPYDPEQDYCRINNLTNCSPNFLLRGDSMDPMLTEMWNYKEFPFPGIPASGIKVMILDSGVNCKHEDLECEKEYNVIEDVEGEGKAADANGHGTHVAGTACGIGDNGKGIQGVSKRCRVYAAKFLGSNGSGSTFDAIKGLRWGIKHDVDVVNMSFGGGARSEPFAQAVRDARNNGIILVGAAGNEGRNNDVSPHYPSNYGDVISVASYEPTGELSSFSNYGLKSVDGAAPGGGILSTLNTGDYGRMSGTSMAAPHITGLIATILSQTEDTDKRARAKRAVQLLHERYTVPRGEGKVGLYFRGVIQEQPPEDPVQCEVKQCKKCFSECLDRFKCKCKKWAECKSECREQTNCDKGCN